MRACNDNGLANETRASKAMFGRWKAKERRVCLFLGVSSLMWCVMGQQRTDEGRKMHAIESYCVEFVKLD
jgi:hypothetical protein